MKYAFLACTAATLALCPAAWAQDSAPTPPTAPSASEAAAATGDIVVTATRTQTLASKTPVALTAISGQQLLTSGVTNATLLAEQVPNLSIDRNNGLQITIRGVSSSDGSEKGDPSAAFMADGIYIARPQAQEVSFYDLNRVEVLRGPQGTLFGRNTTAGLVNVLSNRPVHRFEASLDATYGNYDTRQVTGMLNLPVNDAIAVRGAFNYDRRDSYLRGGTGFTADASPFKDNISGRLSAAFDMGPAKLVLVGDYTNIGGKTLNTVLSTNFYANIATTGVDPLYIGAGKSSEALRTVNSPLTTGLDRRNKVYGGLADFSYDFGPVQLNYLGSYRVFKRNEDLGYQRLTAANFGHADSKSWQNSQELRFSTTGTGPLKAQAGLYYFKERTAQFFYFYGLLSPTPGTRGYVYGFPQEPAESESYAAFGQTTLRVTDRLRLTGGVRYSHDDKSRVGATVTCATTACTAPTDTVSVNNAHRTFQKVTWRGGFDFDVDARTLFYGVVATGYKAGGFNDGCEIGTGTGCTLPAAALYYEPETLKSYELGLKTRFLDNAVRLNASAFHYDYKNIQLSQVSTLCGGPCTVTTNAGAAKVDGVELEGVIAPVRSFKVDFSAAWLDARYTNFNPTAAINWNGKKLDRSPTWTVSGGATQTFDLANGGNVQAGVRTRLVDSYVMAALSTVNQYRQPSYTKTDLSLTYTAPANRYYVQAFARNLENTIVVTTVAAGTFPGVQLSDPLTYGGRIGFRF